MKFGLILTVGIFIGLLQMNAQTPSATLSLYGNSAFCESGNAQFKVAFTGTAPFGFAYKKYPVANPSNWIISVHNSPIQIADLTPEGFWIDNVSISESTVIEIVEVYDGSMLQSNWVYGKGSKNVNGSVIYQIDRTPVPTLGADITNQCGYSIQLNGIPQNSSNSVFWSDVADGTFSKMNIANPVFTASTDKLYTLQFNEVSGTCTGSDQMNITFLGSPVGVLSGSSVICKTGTLNINTQLQGKGPWNYSLQSGSNVISRSGISSSTDVFSTAVTGAQNFTFRTLTDVNGCAAVVSQMTGSAVATDEQPVISAGTDQLICGLSTVLDGTTDKGTGSWSTATSGVTINDLSNAKSPVSSSQYQFATFQWSVNNNGCINTDEVVVNFAANPSLSISDLKDTICNGDATTIKLNLSVSPPWKVRYSDGTNSYEDNFSASPANIEVSPTISTDYLFNRITNSLGCYQDISQTYKAVVEQPVTANAGDDQTFDRQYSATLNGSPADVAGTWELISGRGSIANVSLANTAVSNLAVGDNKFKWTITPKVCPPSSDEMIVSVGNYTTYNGFSPNGDGINDYFVIDGASSDVPNELTVFDQTGKVVYHQLNYNNDWNGTDTAGKQLDAGTYYFAFKSNSTDPVKDYLIIKR